MEPGRALVGGAGSRAWAGTSAEPTRPFPLGRVLAHSRCVGDDSGLRRALLRRLLPTAQRERLDALRFDDLGQGWDTFGASREGAALADVLLRVLYESWFRVESRGAEHVPAEGPVIVAANHSGTLPFDAAMLYLDLLRQTDPPRLPRAIADRFVPALPFVSTFFARGGVVGGTRKNMDHLLERGELVMVFPEGTPGIGKPFSERYQLQRFREGHCELAIRHGAPVVPAAIVGAEEALPQVARLPIRLFGAPYLPIPATPIPFPVRYHVRYGPPIRFDAPPERSDDPETTRAAAAEVQAAVAGLIDEALAEREGLFR